MAQIVREVANPELFAVSDADRAADVLSFLMGLGITTCPVVDPGGVPVGVVGLRELHEAAADSTAGEIMTTPVVTVTGDTSLAVAAERMVESGHHHLISVDAEGRAEAMLSSLDLIRGLAGLPIAHPQAFPHYDPRFGVVWSDEARLDDAWIATAPEERGVLSLISGGAGQRDRVVWSEYCRDLRARLGELIADPTSAPQPLRRWLETGGLRFRTARVADRERAKRTVDVLQRTAGLHRGV
jgi:CBS domain-containing protein